MRLPHLLISMDDTAIGPLAISPDCLPSGSSKNRVKFLCSHGGKILPRPSDTQLKYVGGETRIISAPKDVSFQQLMKKLSFLTKGEMILKYQVVSEDLDALVSVKSDEDVVHMLDEIANWENAGKGSRLRAFLFPTNPVVMENQMGSMDPPALEPRYVDATNGLFRSSSKSNLNMTRYGSTTSFLTTSENCITEEKNRITKLHKVQSMPNICNNNIPKRGASLHLHRGEKVWAAAPPNQYYPNTSKHSLGNDHYTKCLHYDDMNTHFLDRRMIDKTRSRAISPVPSSTRLDMKPKFYI